MLIPRTRTPASQPTDGCPCRFIRSITASFPVSPPHPPSRGQARLGYQLCVVHCMYVSDPRSPICDSPGAFLMRPGLTSDCKSDRLYQRRVLLSLRPRSPQRGRAIEDATCSTIRHPMSAHAHPLVLSGHLHVSAHTHTTVNQSDSSKSSVPFNLARARGATALPRRLLCRAPSPTSHTNDEEPMRRAEQHKRGLVQYWRVLLAPSRAAAAPCACHAGRRANA